MRKVNGTEAPIRDQAAGEEHGRNRVRLVCRMGINDAAFRLLDLTDSAF